MKSRLERTWWYTGTTVMLALAPATCVTRSAGIPQLDNAAQVTLFLFCLVGFERCLSLLGWLLVLWVSPVHAMDAPAVKK
jgi:hypothetical protein